MLARRSRPQASIYTEQYLPAVVAGGATVLAGLLAAHKFGMTGLLAPLVVTSVVLLGRKPVAILAVVVGLTILCEGPDFGLLHFTSHLYDQFYKGMTPLDVLVSVAILSVGIDLIRRRQQVVVARPLIPGLIMLFLGMIAGMTTGHAAGASIRSVVLSDNVLLYLLLLPMAIASLDIDRVVLSRIIAGLAVIAILKAMLGLVEIGGGYGQAIEGSGRLSYYEPAANWVIMITLLGVCAAALIRFRPPLWMLLGSPLLFACLLLSYRRSFWIAAVLAILLVFLIGVSPAGRRLFVPVGLGLAVAIWLLGSINFQSQLPLVKRAASLAPSKLDVNVEDRYRIDERANVLGEIRQHPFTGLGLTIPWAATVQPLSVEHENGRQYVHFAALWFWLKLGVLGLLAYVGILLGAALLAWRAWRMSNEPLLRAFALASLCGIAGLVVIETTASFTGVDPRFTVLLGVQLGLLSLAARTSGSAASMN